MCEFNNDIKGSGLNVQHNLEQIPVDLVSGSGWIWKKNLKKISHASKKRTAELH